jgi:hypothetical protein
VAATQKFTPHEEPNSPWLGLLKVVFIVTFVLICFLLAHSMMHHHFFSGGQLNRHDASRP